MWTDFYFKPTKLHKNVHKNVHNISWILILLGLRFGFKQMENEMQFWNAILECQTTSSIKSELYFRISHPTFQENIFDYTSFLEQFVCEKILGA